jgi:hypothetical protein
MSVAAVEVANAIGYAMHCSRSHDAVIRVYERLRSAVSVESYGTPTSRVIAKLETPKWPFYGMATLRVRFCFGCMMRLAT